MQPELFVLVLLAHLVLLIFQPCVAVVGNKNPLCSICQVPASTKAKSHSALILWHSVTAAGHKRVASGSDLVIFPSSHIRPFAVSLELRKRNGKRYVARKLAVKQERGHESRMVGVSENVFSYSS